MVVVVVVLVLVGVDGLCVLGYGKCRADTGYIKLI